MPVPCALAKPVPAISATVAAVIIKRFNMDDLLTCLYCPAVNEKRSTMFPDIRLFPQFC
jgi:hypothetical protein